MKPTMPPIRLWGEFFLGWRNFARPGSNFHDRLNFNLLYYQTNYLVLSIAFFVSAGFQDPVGRITATAVVVAVFLVSVWAGELLPVAGFKRWNNSALFIAVITVIHLVTLMFVDVRMFLSAAAVSLAVMIVHASFCHPNLSEGVYVREAQKLQGSPLTFLTGAKKN